MLGAASVDALAKIAAGQFGGDVRADPLTMRLLHLDAFGLPKRGEADPAAATPIRARSTSRPITPMRTSWTTRCRIRGLPMRGRMPRPTGHPVGGIQSPGHSTSTAVVAQGVAPVNPSTPPLLSALMEAVARRGPSQPGARISSRYGDHRMAAN